jgi:NAD+ synthetase
MRLALATINPTVGDVTSNAALIRGAIAQAHAAGADLVLLPELALCGYPPRDLLAREGFVEACEQAARTIAADAPKGITVVFGVPLRFTQGPNARACANALVVARDGVITDRYDKQLLPTYDVFDEDRYFEPGDRSVVMGVPAREGPLRVGLTICEDLWMGEDAGFATRYKGRADPVEQLVARGAKLILSASASPFALGKGQKHRDILASHARRHGVGVASVNQLGANDELIFDGHRYLFAPDGSLAEAGRLFEDALLVIDIDASGVVRSPQRQAAAEATPTPSPSHRLIVSPSHTATDAAHLHHALVLGVRDYLRKTGFKKAILGLSGGIDSALTAALAVAAIGKDNVTGYALPGPYSSEHSIADALAVAKTLGMRCDVVSIASPMRGFRDAIDAQFTAMGTTTLGEKLPDLTEENLQSRIRGTLLMAISNRTGAIVLTTGNKSELAVGYCTLYGDMNGGLAVLSDVTKHWVYALSRFINANYQALAGLEHCPATPIPDSTLTKPPSAELRPNQTDQDSLPPYDVLDEILARAIERHQSPATIAREAGFDLALVQKIARMIDLAEYKRRQAAMGLKVTTVAFGTGRRMPIAQRWRGM